MPPLPAPGQPPVASAPSGGGLPGQPPFGATPVTMPTPDRGNIAAATALTRNAMDMLAKALVNLGPAGAASEVGTAVRKAIDILAKLPELAPGATTPGAQRASMQQHQLEQRQMGPILAQLAARGGGQGGGQPAGAAPPGAGAPGPSPPVGAG
jgi:hypothetical protein